MSFSKDDFIDSIKEKNKKYYIYNYYLKPVEHSFFGAFLSVYLAFLFNDFIKIPIPEDSIIEFLKQKYGLAILFSFVVMVEVAVMTTAFDYTLRAVVRVGVYFIPLIIHGIFAYTLTLAKIFEYIPEIVKFKTLWTLPILFIFWAVYREGMRVYSKLTYSFRKKTYFK